MFWIVAAPNGLSYDALTNLKTGTTETHADAKRQLLEWGVQQGFVHEKKTPSRNITDAISVDVVDVWDCSLPFGMVLVESWRKKWIDTGKYIWRKC